MERRRRDPELAEPKRRRHPAWRSWWLETGRCQLGDQQSPCLSWQLHSERSERWEEVEREAVESNDELRASESALRLWPPPDFCGKRTVHSPPAAESAEDTLVQFASSSRRLPRIGRTLFHTFLFFSPPRVLRVLSRPAKGPRSRVNIYICMTGAGPGRDKLNLPQGPAAVSCQFGAGEDSAATKGSRFASTAVGGCRHMHLCWRCQVRRNTSTVLSTASMPEGAIGSLQKSRMSHDQAATLAPLAVLGVLESNLAGQPRHLLCLPASEFCEGSWRVTDRSRRRTEFCRTLYSVA